MVRVRNTRMSYNVLFCSGLILCLFLVGCLDEAAEHSDRGMALWKKGEYDKAIAEFDKALEMDPKNGKAYYYRANAYYDEGRYGKAWDDVHAAQELGYRIAPRFLKILREVSGRER